MNYNITNKIEYIGVNDKTLDLFESQYVIPNGISYNSYIIQDEKTVIMDTVDKRKVDEWLQNVENVLENKKPDYLVVSHLEPDHSAGISIITEKYSEMKIVLSKRAKDMLLQFINKDLSNRLIVVQEGDILELGHQHGTSSGLPGPFERKRPSGESCSIVSLVVFQGRTVTSQPQSFRRRTMFCFIPQSIAATWYR